jgi:hypothetical protein
LSRREITGRVAHPLDFSSLSARAQDHLAQKNAARECA